MYELIGIFVAVWFALGSLQSAACYRQFGEAPLLTGLVLTMFGPFALFCVEVHEE